VTNIPVKTRLPVKAWFFAGLVTFLSMVSSLLHFIASGGIAHVEQASMAFLPRGLPDCPGLKTGHAKNSNWPNSSGQASWDRFF
jgi:hypothetical protein